MLLRRAYGVKAAAAAINFGYDRIPQSSGIMARTHTLAGLKACATRCLVEFMKPISHAAIVVTLPLVLLVLPLADRPASRPLHANPLRAGEVTVHRPAAFDVSAPVEAAQNPQAAPITVPVITTPAGSATVEQGSQGTKPAATLVASFDGLGVGFEGPQGPATLRSPSDNTLAVGPDHIVQIVNSRMAIFTKKGKKYDTTGKALYGAVNTSNVFKGFGGTCEARNNGDAVVRYDQLADRWLIVMPIFGRAAVRPDQPPNWKGGDPTQVAPTGVPGQPGRASQLFQPPPA